ncbi:hypothetical protein [Streptomyces sp. BA2]|uniref:hypothetical protein n=1 Tax=Streptomyces sp. BA2 TaxID=436595 RepID=UPI001F470D21|nr:hypothetical protein [Streptomyces sp. BA2]
MGNVQVGNAETEPGQRYELVVWKFDARLTGVARPSLFEQGIPMRGKLAKLADRGWLHNGPTGSSPPTCDVTMPYSGRV